MNNQDPIADMLTRIRNANRTGRKQVSIPKSKICIGIAEVLKSEGYVEDFEVIEEGVQGAIKVKLRYSLSGEKVIHEIDRVSKPGRRVYSAVGDLPRVADGLGVTIVSTPQGVMADHEARERNVGGEVLCKVF